MIVAIWSWPARVGEECSAAAATLFGTVLLHTGDRAAQTWGLPTHALTVRLQECCAALLAMVAVLQTAAIVKEAAQCCSAPAMVVAIAQCLSCPLHHTHPQAPWMV